MEWGITEVAAIALIILSLIFLGSYTKLWANVLTSTHKNEISTWVLTTNAKLSGTGGHGQDTGSPPSMSLYDKPIEFTDEKDFLNNANRRIADAMLDCWETFSYGTVPFLGADYRSEAFCFPCAQIKFSQEIKNKYPSLDNALRFRTFLNQPISKNGPTYGELFNNRAVIDSDLSINTNEDFYIIFAASKGDIKARLTNSGVSPLNNIYWATFAPGMDSFYSSLILAKPQKIQEICNP